MKGVNIILGKMCQKVEHEFKILFGKATKAADISDTEIRLPRRLSSTSAMSDPETFTAFRYACSLLIKALTGWFGEGHREEWQRFPFIARGEQANAGTVSIGPAVWK